jgi:hypothetical protein
MLPWNAREVEGEEELDDDDDEEELSSWLISGR